MRRVAMVVGAFALVLAACGDTDGDGDADLDPVAAAEQRVSRAEDALAEAETAFDDASGEFCADATSYVDAIDRYARVFTDAQATVGDVTTAGRDLAEPQEEAVSSADAARDAHEEVGAAEAELADAQAALAEAESGTTAPESEDATTTTETIVPPASVDRVTTAQDDLDAAFAGIAPETTLVQAGQQVNAAAVALEAAWLRVLADAGCLTDDQQAQAVEAISSYTAAVQTALTTAGFYDGPIDGVYGPATADAVARFQTEEGLPVTGFIDQATGAELYEAVFATGADAAQAAAAHTAAVQTLLAIGGYWTGPIDGQWTDALTAAVGALQTDLGVPVTGAMDAATIAAVQAAVADAQEPTTTTTVPVEGEEEGTTSTTTA